MKTAVATIALAALGQVAQAHYMFQFLTANGAKGSLYQNIRPVRYQTSGLYISWQLIEIGTKQLASHRSLRQQPAMQR
jgi:hypothetical protein